MRVTALVAMLMLAGWLHAHLALLGKPYDGVPTAAARADLRPDEGAQEAR